MQMTIEERIERLERENRWLKRIWVGAALVMACCVAVAVTSGVRAQTKPVPRIVEAEKFVLKDAQGHVRGEFGTLNDGESVHLDLYNAPGEQRVSLATGEKIGTSLSMGDATGKLGALLMSDKDRTLLQLGNTTEGPRASLAVAKDGTLLGMYDATGKDRATLSSWSDEVLLKLSNAHGFRTSIGNTGLVAPATGETHQTSAASIRMFNDKGDVIWSAPTQ